MALLHEEFEARHSDAKMVSKIVILQTRLHMVTGINTGRSFRETSSPQPVRHTGELIGRYPSSIHQHFQTTSPLKPRSQF